MAQYVDLDALVPDDIDFEYGGRIYTLPGDPPNQAVLVLLRSYQVLAGAIDDDPGEEREKRVQAADAAIEQTLLDQFRRSDPSIEAWPFGMHATRLVAQQVLIQLGLLKVEEKSEEPDDEDPPEPRKGRRPGSSSRSPR